MANLLRLSNHLLIDGIVKFSSTYVVTKEGTLGIIGLNGCLIDFEL